MARITLLVPDTRLEGSRLVGHPYVTDSVLVHANFAIADGCREMSYMAEDGGFEILGRPEMGSRLKTDGQWSAML